MTEVPVKIIKKNGKVVEPDDWMDDPIKADKWRNIYILNDGSAITAQILHTSEEMAKKASLSAWKRNLKLGNSHHSGRCEIANNSFLTGRYWHEVVYTLQMPVTQ